MTRVGSARRLSTLLTAIVGVVALTSGAAVGSVSTAAANANYQPLPTVVIHDLSVPASTLAAVGSGHAGAAPRLSTAKEITKNGKPEVAFVLGEFCPYCAAESWALAVALERFGAFSGLTTLTSSASDPPPSIQTISFRYSHYSSRYVAFDPIVNEDTNLKHVEPVPANVRPTWKHDGETYPFVDFAGFAILRTASFSPNVIAGLSRAEIAGDLAHPSRTVAQAIDGAANQLTAAICLATKNKPAKICGSKTISALEHSLKR